MRPELHYIHTHVGHVLCKQRMTSMRLTSTFTISLISPTSYTGWLLIVDCSDSCVLLFMREIIEQITAGSLMVRSPIILVQRPISLGLSKDLCNYAITVRRPLKWRKSMDHRTPSCNKFYWIWMKQALKEGPEAALHNSVQLWVIIVSSAEIFRF